MILKIDKFHKDWYCPIELDKPFYSPMTEKYYETYDELEKDVKKFRIEVRKIKLLKIYENR